MPNLFFSFEFPVESMSHYAFINVNLSASAARYNPYVFEEAKLRQKFELKSGLGVFAFDSIFSTPT